MLNAMTVLAGFLALLSLPVAGAWGVPKISCQAPLYDFGSRDSSDLVEHTFLISNEGAADLDIGRVTGCCGAATDMAQKRLPPGTNAPLHVRFSLAGREGKLNKSIYIGSNDPTQPYYQLRIIGTVTAMVSARPASVDFGRIPADATVESEVSLLCQTNFPVAVTSLVLEGRGFAMTNEAVVGGYRIKVRTVPPLDQGGNRGKVVILTDNPRCRRIEIPLVATVSADIVVVPGEIQLVGSERRAGAVTRYVSIRSRSGREFKILGVSLPAKDMISEVSRLDDGYRVVIRNIVPSEDIDGKDVTISTDHPEGRQIILPIHVSAGDSGS